ncbi:metallophosphoesterase [Taibaiella soli]|nr:metallophosphoesterase [Taibaiella soli]
MIPKQIFRNLLPALAGAAFFTACHSTNKTAHQSKDGFSFFVLGDWGNKGGGSQIPVANEMITQSAAYKPSMILTVGDNFYEDGVKDLQDEHWQLSYENVYKDLTKKCAWYVALGNHDYRGNVDAELQYHTVNPNWNMPARYYTFVKNISDKVKVRFIVLDTDPYADSYYTDPKYKGVFAGQDTAAQTRWVKETLAASKEQWKIVIGHHPVYCLKPKAGEIESLKKAMEPLFKEYGVQAYICGHDHIMQYHTPAGKTGYIISGAGAKPTPKEKQKESFTAFTAGVPAFTAITMTEKELQFNFIDTTGTIVYHNSIKQ